MTRNHWLQLVSLLAGITVVFASWELATAKDKNKGSSHSNSSGNVQHGSQSLPGGAGHSRGNFSSRSRSGIDGTGNSGNFRGTESRNFDARSLNPRTPNAGNSGSREFNSRIKSGNEQPRRVETFRPPTNNSIPRQPSGKIMDGDPTGSNRTGTPRYPKYNPGNTGTVDSQNKTHEAHGHERHSSSRHPKNDGPNLDQPKFDKPKFDPPRFDNSNNVPKTRNRITQPGNAGHDHPNFGTNTRDNHPDHSGKFDRLPQGARDSLNKSQFPHDLKLGPNRSGSGNRQDVGVGSGKLNDRHREPNAHDHLSGHKHGHEPNFSHDKATRDRYDIQRHRLNHGGTGHNHAVDAATLAKWSKQSWYDKSDRAHYDKLIKNTGFEHYHLDRQYRLHDHGDIARQLNLQQNFVNHGGWQHRHVGVVSSQFRNQCWYRPYWGPSWFPQTCWYPRWSPWVSWSWGFQCNPWFDPRPTFCRPVIYTACQPWTFWQYPVWQPLPVVAAGTWVNVPQVMAPQGFDVRLLAVRFVDPGQPDRGLGQRYRIWIRNDSRQDIEQPFNVVLMGTNDLIPGERRLEVGQRVPNLAAGKTVAIDLRLPIAPEGAKEPMAFEKLHALVDANRELNDVEMTNNGAVLDRGDILPVDPAAFNVDADLAATGQVITLAGEGLGPGPGQVLLQVGNETYQPEIIGWYDLGVQLRVPAVEANGLTEGDLVVVRADGAATNPLAIQIAGTEGGREF